MNSPDDVRQHVPPSSTHTAHQTHQGQPIYTPKPRPHQSLQPRLLQFPSTSQTRPNQTQPNTQKPTPYAAGHDGRRRSTSASGRSMDEGHRGIPPPPPNQKGEDPKGTIFPAGQKPFQACCTYALLGGQGRLKSVLKFPQSPKLPVFQIGP